MKQGNGIKIVDIGEEILTREENPMDVTEIDRENLMDAAEIDRDRYPGGRDMMDIGLVIAIRPGGDQTLEVEKDSGEIDRERQVELQISRGALGASARLVSRSGRLWSRSWMARLRTLMRLLPMLISARKDSLWEKRC